MVILSGSCISCSNDDCACSKSDYDPIGSQGCHQVKIVGIADRRDLRADGFDDLHCSRSDRTGCTVDKHLLSGLYIGGCHPAGEFAATGNRVGNISEPEHLRRTISGMDEGFQCEKYEKEVE